MIHKIIDLIGIMGILMLALGLYLVSPVWMFTVIGTMFIGFSLCSEAGTISINLRKKEVQ